MYIHNLRIKKNSAIFSLSLIYIYIYMCVCVCVCVCNSGSMEVLSAQTFAIIEKCKNFPF